MSQKKVKWSAPGDNFYSDGAADHYELILGIWRKLLALLDADGDGVVTTEELKALDIDGDGKLSKVRISLSIFDCV